jgi:hypothetical protein
VTPTTGAPEIEFHRRGLAVFYFVAAIVAVVIGIMFVIVGLATAAEPGPWSGKWLSVVEWCVFGIGWACGGPQFWKMAGAYQHNLVRLGADHAWPLLGTMGQWVYGEASARSKPAR